MIYNLNIKTKYFNAILEGNKNFELRHQKYKKGDILILNEIGLERKIFVKVLWSGKLLKSNTFNINSFYYRKFRKNNICVGYYTFSKKTAWNLTFGENEIKWYDEFCWNYINEKQTYLIQFRILVKGE